MTTYRRIIIPAQLGAAMFGFSLAILLAPTFDLPSWGRIIAMVVVFLLGVGGVLTALIAARGLLRRDE